MEPERTGSTRPILGEQLDTVGVHTPTKLSADPVGEGAGIDGAVPGGRLEDVLELGLKGTSVPPRPRPQPSNDICPEITDKNLCHWPPPRC